MATPPSRLIRRTAVAVAAVVVASTAIVLAQSADAAAPTAPASPAPAVQKPATPGSVYLALGDSVSFGYRESNTFPTPNYHHPKSFVGFPNYVASALGLRLVNAACPGETTGSFLNVDRPSNGCTNAPGGAPGYRAAYPLHVKYSGSQMNFAIKFLKSYPNTRLVTLMIGANDGFLCQETTPNHCANRLLAVLQRVGRNVATILKRLRVTGGYHGQIVILNYYATNYQNATSRVESLALNNAVDTAAKPFHVRFANGYGALKAAARQAHGNTCKAGLLTQLTSGGCGVHPSLAGQALLANAVEQKVTK